MFLTEIGAQRFDDADGLFNGLVGLRQGAACLLHSRNPKKRSSLSIAVKHRPPERQGLIVFLQRLLRLSQQPIDLADAVEYSGLLTAVARRPTERQSLVVFLQSLPRLTHKSMGPPDFVECGGLLIAVAYSSIQLQSLLILFDALSFFLYRS